LFIDEAHHLYKPDNERDYGSEAVELLLQVMENQREDLIIISAVEKIKLTDSLIQILEFLHVLETM
jgi:archaellum biogenesis ATPase FlaH